MNAKKTQGQLQKRIEELEEREKFLEEILEGSSSISIIATDKTGNITYWNSGAENIFGWKAHEVIGKSINIIYPEDEKIKKDMLSLRKVVYKNRSVNFELPEVSRDGQELIINMNLTPRFDKDGNLIGILGIGQNITKQKIAETRLANIETYSGFLELALPNKELQGTSIQILRDLIQNILISAQHNTGSGMGKINEIQKQLALVLYELGEYEEAKELLVQILSAMEILKEPDHEKIAEIQSNLAMVLYDLKNIDKARDMAQKALDFTLKNYSEDNYLIDIRKTNLALILQECGDLEKAEALTQEAYESLIKKFGHDHSDTKIAKHNLEIIKNKKE